MHKRYYIAVALAVMTALVFSIVPSFAQGNGVVISQVQLGNSISASNEFIEIYNNSSSDIEVTNWCLYYASANVTSIGSKLSCFTPENDLIHLYLPTHSSMFAISTILAINSPTLESDLKFSATLSGTAGHVRLVNASGDIIDKVGWGITASSPEGLTPATTPPVGRVLQRKNILNSYQDSDNNSVDFEAVMPRATYNFGEIYEVQDLCSNITGIQLQLPPDYTVDVASICSPPPVDVCANLDGLQLSLPDRYGFDESRMCLPDVCLNIIGLQTSIPDGKESDLLGNCIDHDMCSNIDAIQIDVPLNYKMTANNCWLDLPPVFISEILPNAIGTDTGHEFIELYNPNSIQIDLSLYRLKVGLDLPRLFTFPAGATIAPNEYVYFSNDDIPFTLLNTSSRVQLTSADSQLIADSPIYSQPLDGMTWALINNNWQFTNQPTPSKANLPSLIVDTVDEIVTGQQPCPQNQTRNPDTNRCRLIITVSSSLVACRDGQYRSETTNRCRNLSTDISLLVPCDDNQERNPVTHRCKAIVASTSTIVTACKEGQERNADTNRCRTITKMSDVGFAVQPIVKNESNITGLFAIGGILVVALTYGIWEWRVEIIRAWSQILVFLHAKK